MPLACELWAVSCELWGGSQLEGGGGCLESALSGLASFKWVSLRSNKTVHSYIHYVTIVNSSIIKVAVENYVTSNIVDDFLHYWCFITFLLLMPHTAWWLWSVSEEASASQSPVRGTAHQSGDSHWSRAPHSEGGWGAVGVSEAVVTPGPPSTGFPQSFVLFIKQSGWSQRQGWVSGQGSQVSLLLHVTLWPGWWWSREDVR